MGGKWVVSKRMGGFGPRMSSERMTHLPGVDGPDEEPHRAQHRHHRAEAPDEVALGLEPPPPQVEPQEGQRPGPTPVHAGEALVAVFVVVGWWGGRAFESTSQQGVKYMYHHINGKGQV